MWKMCQYTIAGRGHIKSNLPCQDKTITLTKKGVCVIALADGAGSASLSHHGAQVVVESIAEYIANRFDELVNTSDGVTVKSNIIAYLLEQLKVVAEKHQCELKSLASTLLCVAVKDNRYMIIHLGDGVIGYLKENSINIASSPTNGEFANSTYFVTSNRAVEHLKIMKGYLNNISGFVLMSDGSAESFHQKSTQKLVYGLKKLMMYSALLPSKKTNDMLESLFTNVISKKTFDDCSLAVLIQADGINTLRQLSLEDQMGILGVRSFHLRKARKRVERLNRLLEYLDQPKTIKEVGVRIRTRKKYIKSKLNSLISLGVVNRINERLFVNSFRDS